MLGTGCTSTGLGPGVPTAVTVGTSLAVNAYPGAAPFVEMTAGAIRSLSAQGVPTPTALAVYLRKYAVPAEAIAGDVSTTAKADVVKFVAAVNAKYAQVYPSIEKGDMTIEQFAQAVENGA